MEKISVWVVHGDGGENRTGPAVAFCGTEPRDKIVAKGKGQRVLGQIRLYFELAALKIFIEPTNTVLQSV